MNRELSDVSALELQMRLAFDLLRLLSGGDSELELMLVLAPAERLRVTPRVRPGARHSN